MYTRTLYIVMTQHVYSEQSEGLSRTHFKTLAAENACERERWRGDGIG